MLPHSAASPPQAPPLGPRDRAQLYAHSTQGRCWGRSQAGHLGGALARLSRSWGSPKEGGPPGRIRAHPHRSRCLPPGRPGSRQNATKPALGLSHGLDQHLGSGAGCSPKQLGDLEANLWPPGSPQLIYRTQLVPRLSHRRCGQRKCSIRVKNVNKITRFILQFSQNPVSEKTTWSP